MMKKSFPNWAASLLLAAIVAAPRLSAQGIITGSISGTAADPTGAMLPDAKVVAVNPATNLTAVTIAGADGSFSFNDLLVGKYTITISAKGFSTLTLTDVVVDAARVEALGMEKLQPGTTAVTVEVTSAQDILETAEAQVTTSFDSQALVNLPTNGGFDELALLVPGVAATHADNFSNTNGAGFSVNGERGRSNNFELDGQSNNDNSVTGPQAFFGNDEALAQVQIITNNFGAQYGRNAGSVVNYITKSGANSIHGAAIYKFSGDFTSSLAQGASKGPQFGFCSPGQTPAANSCVAPVVPRYTSNFYGGDLGAPIIKDKLFAFGSTYFHRFTETGALTSSGASLFPTTAGLAQLATAFPNSPGVAVLQQLSPYAVPAGNPRQTGPAVNETIASGGQTLTVPFAQFGRHIPSLTTDQEDLGRLDWQATSRDRMYLRYFYQKNPTTPSGVPPANGGFVDVTDVVHSVGADETHTFNSNWVDQLRYSFQQSILAFDGGGFPNCTITAFQTCPSDVLVAGSLSSGASFTGLGLPSNDPQGRIVKNGQIQNNATWNFGRHAVTFGGEFDYTNSPNTFLPNASGVISYDNLNDFITGTCAASVSCTATLDLGNPVIPFKENDVAFYLQDDWKVAPSLTLNLGVRWEFFQQSINLLHNESVANQTGPNPIWNTALPLSQTTLPFTPNYYKNVEPRFGFAYNPQYMKKLVVRGGYAINADPAFYNINLDVSDAAPVVVAGTANCNSGVNCIPTGGATFVTAQTQIKNLIPVGSNPGLDNQSRVGSNFRNPIGQTFSLGIQYQIQNSAVLEARYVGNHTSRQFQARNANPYLLPVATAFPNVVNPASLCTATDSTLAGGADIGHLNCGETNVRSFANTSYSLYNALQTSLTTSNYRGVTASINYTWSHTIDNASEIFSTGGGGNTIAYAQNPLNTDRPERANSGIDYPNTASISFIYALPNFHAGHEFINRMANGWSLTSIWIYNSGEPFTFFQPNTLSAGTVLNKTDPRTTTSYSDPKFDAAFVAYDVARPILSNPRAPMNTVAVYTDTTVTPAGNGTAAVFSAPVLEDYKTGAPVTPENTHWILNNQLAANLLGNPYPGAGRETNRGDTFSNVDASIHKDTKITERVAFRFEADAYNVLNRSYYSAPGANVSDYLQGNFNNFFFNSASGSLTGSGVGVRNMLFVGKIIF